MVPEDDSRIDAQTITYPGASGELQGYLVRNSAHCQDLF
jgi:hypothetical protein